mgnify:CR=1 FL=1
MFRTKGHSVTDIFRHGVQQTVDELRVFLVEKGVRDVEIFVDHRRRWDIRARNQFIGTAAQKLKHRLVQTAHLPLFAKLGINEQVNFFAAGINAGNNVVEKVGVGIRRSGSLILVDEQLTPFVEGTHTSNRSQQNSVVELPGVGEVLEAGDEVGLLFYEQQVQYAAVVSALSLPGLTNVVNFALGTSIPAIGSALDGSLIAAPNPYEATVSGVELPILRPGEYPGSSLRR